MNRSPCAGLAAAGAERLLRRLFCCALPILIAVGLVFDSVEKALKQLPDAVLLSAEGYQALLNKIEALEKLAKPDRQPVNECKLSGRLEESYMLLRADLVVVTDRPQTLVPLGFQGAVPVDGGDLDPQNL